MFEKPYVLVVDDIREVRELFRCVLETSGYVVTEAEDATAAIMALRQRFYHIVLLDIHLPGMSGLQALGEIRALSPYTKVIMITGDGSLPAAIEAMDHEAFAFLEKPIDVNKLMVTLSEALADQREQFFRRHPLKARVQSLGYSPVGESTDATTGVNVGR
ncbi:MAG TPA: response regulator [Blastocatellia bacterium]|nr:response regulator [Blastocatellia bacterium]